jgi:hypothetical protein
MTRGRRSRSHGGRPSVWRDLFLASTLGINPAQFGRAWGVAHSLASNTASDLLAKVFQLATKYDMVGAPANCAGSAPCIVFGYSAQECNREKRLLPNNS